MGSIVRLSAPLALCLATVPAFAAELGEEIPDAVIVHVSEGGLRRVGDVISAMVPPAIHLEAVEDSFTCDPADGPTLYYGTDPLDVELIVDAVEIVPSEGRLDVTVHATVGSTPATMYAVGSCGVLEGLWESCDLQVPTTAITAHTGVTLARVGDRFEAVADPVSVELSPINNPLGDCTLASGIGVVLDRDPDAISNLLLSYVEPELQGVREIVETALEDQLDQLAFDTAFSLGAAELQIEIGRAHV